MRMAQDSSTLRGRRSWPLPAPNPGVDVPHAIQAFAIERRITTKPGMRMEIALDVTNLPVRHARADRLAGLVGEDRKIEALHHQRHVTFGDDASRIRTGNAPQLMAGIRDPRWSSG
jgi:hypothetical protein